MTTKRTNHIARWRTFKGFNARQLADRLSDYANMHGVKVAVSPQSLSRIEGGKQNFTVDFLEAVAAVLATGEDDPTPGDLLKTNPFEGMAKASGYLEKLTPRQQRLALSMLQTMLAEDQLAFRDEEAAG